MVVFLKLKSRHRKQKNQMKIKPEPLKLKKKKKKKTKQPRRTDRQTELLYMSMKQTTMFRTPGENERPVGWYALPYPLRRKNL
jgi:hypothetical protein